MKKIVTLILICIFITSTLVGCSSDPPLKKPEAIKKAQASSTPEASKKASITAGAGFSSLGDISCTAQLNDTVCYDETNAICVGPDSSIARAVSLANWENIRINTTDLYAVTYATSSIVYICGTKGQVLKSTDGGTNYSQMPKFGESEPNQFQLISFCDENNGIVASKNRVAITSDGANTWTDLKVPSTILAVHMLSPDTIYYVDSEFNLQKSVDGGKNWESSPLSIPEQENCVKELRKMALFVKDDNTYSICCVQNLSSGSNRVACLSTTDSGKNFALNYLPSTFTVASLHFNHVGNLLTVTGNKTIQIYTKKQ